MIPNRTIAQLCLAGILCVAPIAGTAQVKFFGVGDLPGGIVQSEVRDTAKVGNVLFAVGGSSAVGAGNDTAFLWTSTGGITPLPPLVAGLTDSSNAVIGSAITPDAVYIAARARFNPANTAQRHAVRVTTSGLVNLDLGALPGFNQASVANGISNDGSILYGFARYESGGKTQAVRYTVAGPTITAIPFLNVGDNTSSPAARGGTSADGSVMVGTSANNGNGSGPGNAAFRYVQGVGISAIPLLAGGTWSNALAVSPNGNLALVGGDSTVAPLGEVYLYNATASTVTPLGSPALGFGANTVGGMTSDGSVVALTFGSPDDPYSSGFVRNSAGWHDVRAILANAGVNLAGWSIDAVNGMSSDGTRIWGGGTHNGNFEGWLAEFPAGYLAAYGASLPAQSIVGAISSTDTTTEGASVVAFLANGTYFNVEDARVSDAPTGFDGYERGTYTWDPLTKAFTLTTAVDTNGDTGPSNISGTPGLTVTRENGIFTLTIPGGGFYSSPFVTGSSPIVGGWVFGDSALANSSDFIVFFANGTYLMADDSGGGDAVNHPGMERGTYTWDQATGAFTATAIVDTNGDRGLSHIGAGVTALVAGNTLTLTIPSEGAFPFARVVASPLAPSVVVSESRRDHAAAGTFDLVLGTVTTSPTTEPRFGPVQNVVFTFDKPVTAGVAAVTEGTALAGAPTFTGSQMTVPLTAVGNAQYVTVTVSSVTAADGGTGGAGSIRLGFLAGDVNQNRVVSLADLGLVNAQVAQQVTMANYLKDVNASGTLSLADKGLTNTKLTTALPLP